MNKMVKIYNSMRNGESDKAWYRRAKRRELVLVAGQHWRASYPMCPLHMSEMDNLVARGVRVPRSMRRYRDHILAAL